MFLLIHTLQLGPILVENWNRKQQFISTHPAITFPLSPLSFKYLLWFFPLLYRSLCFNWILPPNHCLTWVSRGRRPSCELAMMGLGLILSKFVLLINVSDSDTLYMLVLLGNLRLCIINFQQSCWVPLRLSTKCLNIVTRQSQWIFLKDQISLYL